MPVCYSLNTTCTGHNRLCSKPKALVLCPCSYVWSTGALRGVPASRADIFRDRSLSPADKRALMRFLHSSGQLLQQAGPLQVHAY